MGWFDFLRKRFDTNKVGNEVKPYLPLDLAVIDSWRVRYENEKKSILHPYVEIAQTLMNAGQHEKASEFYMRFLNDQNDDRVHGMYLQNLLLCSSTTNASLLKAHKEWAELYDSPARRVGWEKGMSKEKNKKIKLGYVCHFFANSIAHNCFLPFLKLHDKSRFEIYCYDDGETPEHLRQYADHWLDTRGKSDSDLAALIKQHGIDILQEMNGFCIINRFNALSYRPAPIQINWYNHTSTTGLPFIDYVMSDRVSIADDDIPYYVEQVYRCDQFNAAVRYDAELFGSRTQEPPVKKNGFITFGNFGSGHKITHENLDAWARVLKQVPNSRLILKCGTFSHDLYRRVFATHFANRGIAGDRVILLGWTEQADALKKYNEIDIMLDNMPVTGGSTTFEALMQGVPIVTLRGQRWAARSGASVLTTLNHPELIAETVDDYVKLATTLACKPGQIAHYRKQLHEEMVTSSLTNIHHFYKNFETAYLHMWERWCSSETV